jgi:hypothetical protein
MRGVITCVMAVTGLLALVSLAQGAAKHTPREAAIRKCHAQAAERYPAGNRGSQHNRDRAYSACIHDAGHRP